MREQFLAIAQKLSQIDCSFKRYCMNYLEEGLIKNYSGLSARTENQFEALHELLECRDEKRRYELWHFLSNGQLKIEELNSLLNSI